MTVIGCISQIGLYCSVVPRHSIGMLDAPASCPQGAALSEARACFASQHGVLGMGVVATGWGYGSTGARGGGALICSSDYGPKKSSPQTPLLLGRRGEAHSLTRGLGGAVPDSYVTPW